MKILGSYKNGNYTVTILSDGTKIRHNNEDKLIPSTVESMDIKITNQCDMGCAMCHENSTPNGKHGDIMKQEFIDKLHPYTELAIGGGNPLSHPDLIPFLEKCKSLKLIPSMTVNQLHFMNNLDLIKYLVDNELIYGLGISLVSATNDFIIAAKQFKNAVIHVINGIVTRTQLETLADEDLKILILGYKRFRRGQAMYDAQGPVIEEVKSMLYDILPNIIETEWFKAVSFDNLALEQLDVKRLMSDAEWEEFYMGDDGIGDEFDSATMYIDMVEEKFAKNSCDPNRYDLLLTVDDMYQFLRASIK